MRTVAPTLHQHNAEIFDRLGLSAAEIERLRATGVV
jgi:crotonobetainyl-CoA:carnitine CoA-transferase CaiB-like acyl-CoA transferase